MSPEMEGVAEDEILWSRSNQHRDSRLPLREHVRYHQHDLAGEPDTFRAPSAWTDMHACKYLACDEDLGSNSRSFRTSRVRPLTTWFIIINECFVLKCFIPFVSFVSNLGTRKARTWRKLFLHDFQNDAVRRIRQCRYLWHRPVLYDFVKAFALQHERP